MASPGKKAYALRIDPGVWAALERMAAQDLRSVNAQIEYLLRDALQRRGALPPTGTRNPTEDTPSSSPSAPT